MNTSTPSTPYGPMPTALEALAAIVADFDRYADHMQNIGYGHADYDKTREIAHMVIAHLATTPETPIARSSQPESPIARSAPVPRKLPLARKPKAVKAEQPIVDTASLKRDELFKHFKSTAPCEDLRFFLDATHDTISQAQVDEATVLVGLFDANGKLTIPRPEYYKRLIRLQDHWRQGASERWTRERATDRQNDAAASAWLRVRV